MQASPAHIDYKVLYEQSQEVIEQLQFTIATLKHELEQIKKMIFGSKHERFVPSGAENNIQLSLDLDAETIAQCKITDATEVKYIRTKAEVTTNKPIIHPGRTKLPEHLRRETIVLNPDIDISKLKKIGEEVTEVLDFIPGEFFVKQFIRPKPA